MKAIADTGFLVAFANRKDQHHKWALRLAQTITEPLLTCEAVLAETAFQVNSVAVVLSMVQLGMLTVGWNARAETESLMGLALRYADRQPDFADLCLIRMSEQNPKHSVITTDVSDFRVYRRNQREIIPLIHPPGL